MSLTAQQLFVVAHQPMSLRANITEDLKMTKPNSFPNAPVASRHICVVGAGRWGKNHIKTLHELSFLTGIVEADSDTRNMFKRKISGRKDFRNCQRCHKRKTLTGSPWQPLPRPILK